MIQEKMIQESNFCFGTLAFGANYRALALELANDLEKYAPGIPLLILTDKPQYFQNRNSNILPIRHKQLLYCDNDKKFLIEKALSLFDTCICIDADMRILAPIPSNLKFLPGITARSCTNLTKHLTIRLNKTNPPRSKLVREVEVTKKLAQKLDLDLDNDPIKFIYECLFVVQKQNGKEVEFISLIEKISRYFELHNVFIGIGTAMGLATAKFGVSIRHDTMDEISFFDDRIEKVRISKGQADPNEKAIYFERLKMLKYPKRSILTKVSDRMTKELKNFSRSGRLKLDTLKDFDFYYR